MKHIKNFFMALIEGIQEARNYQAKGYAEYYLSKSVDQQDLERRQKILANKGVL